MSASIVTFEKPVQHLGLADWHAKLWEQSQTASTRRSDAFDLRHQARQLRNETQIKTNWDTYHNNTRLADRITELNRWKDTLEAALNRVNSEMGLLRDEKATTERELDALQTHMGILSECLSIRDCRFGAELTYDDGDIELKKELCVLENTKKLLTDRCQSAWEKLVRLEEVKFKLTKDINDKTESIEIDKDMLTLDKNCAGISYKPDALRISKRAIPYQTWLEHSRYTKLLADNELADTAKMREILYIARERGRNDLKAQRDTTDFALRKRIYETQRARNELEWQQLKMREEMESLQKEIQKLDEAFQNKVDSMKLAETRLETRTYRPGFEIARDEPEMGLRDEVNQLYQTRKDLADKRDCAKTTYNALEEMQLKIEKDLNNKQHSLMTDIRCLDLRARLKTENVSGSTATQRNIVLTKMEKEIPPT